MDKIVSDGVYKGYKFYIRFKTLMFKSFYCGYVEIPIGHSLYGVDEDDLEYINVHGGLTFSGKSYFSDEYLLGFDCGHASDDTSVEDESYTVNECMRLIDQLERIDLQNKNNRTCRR